MYCLEFNYSGAYIDTTALACGCAPHCPFQGIHNRYVAHHHNLFAFSYHSVDATDMHALAAYTF